MCVLDGKSNRQLLRQAKNAPANAMLGGVAKSAGRKIANEMQDNDTIQAVEKTVRVAKILRKPRTPSQKLQRKQSNFQKLQSRHRKQTGRLHAKQTALDLGKNEQKHRHKTLKKSYGKPKTKTKIPRKKNVIFKNFFKSAGGKIAIGVVCVVLPLVLGLLFLFLLLGGLTGAVNQTASTTTSTESSADWGGNARLLDNKTQIFQNAEMDFYSVSTKNGNVFYVFIDKRIVDGENNVFFLNKVDEADLLMLIEDDEKELRGIVQKTPETTETTDETTTTSQGNQTDKPKKGGMNLGSIIVLIVCGLGGFGVWFFLLRKKNKPTLIEPEEEEYLEG